MRILSVGRSFSHPAVINTEFSSNHTLLDADLILLDPLPIYAHYRANSTLSADDMRSIVSIFIRRREQLKLAFQNGRNVVLFPRYLAPLRYYKSYGMTQRFDLNVFFPWGTGNLSQEEGSRFECSAEGPLKRFWNDTNELTSYHAVLMRPAGRPIFHITGTDRVVGALQDIENGMCLYLPPLLSVEELSKVDHDPLKIENEYIDSLVRFINQIVTPAPQFELPDWHANVRIPGELDALGRLENLEVQRRGIDQNISSEKEGLENIELLKVLFTGTGDVLVKKVKTILAEIGMEVEEGEAGRDDLIAKYGEMEFVIEVKGKGSSAAEKDAAQLTKWVAGYLEKHARHAKGLLVVNAFKDELPGDRVQEAFPDQMLKYCEQQELCLMTGLQLLGIYLQIKEDPKKRDELMAQIYSTVGVFPDFQNYEEFLTDAPATDE